MDKEKAAEKTLTLGVSPEAARGTVARPVKMDSLEMMLGDLTADREVEHAYRMLLAPPEFSLTDLIHHCPEAPRTGTEKLWGIPIVETRAVEPGEVRLMEGGYLTDISTLKVERRWVLVQTHFNDAPDPEGVRLLCAHVGGSTARCADARVTRQPECVTCINCYMTLKTRQYLSMKSARTEVPEEEKG